MYIMEYSFIPNQCLDIDCQRYVHDLTYNEFEQVVQNPEYISVIQYYKIWCTECKNIEPFYQKLPNDPKYKNVRFFRVNININDDTIMRCKDCDTPIFQFYRGGYRLCQVSNPTPEQLVDVLNNVVAKHG